MNKHIVGNYERITKRQAEVRYKHGEDIVIVPCKFRPDSWVAGTHNSNNPELRNNFEQLVNEIRFYNCNYETGYYPAFYRLLVRDGEKA